MNDPAVDTIHLDGQTIPVSHDGFLDGRVTVIQPAKGFHRSGSDAVLLAAACPAVAGHVIDLGCGSGAAGLCLMHRVVNLSMTWVDHEPVMLECARLAAELNEQIARTTIKPCDLMAGGRARMDAGLDDGIADHVIMNPPYRPSHAMSAPLSDAKRNAHHDREDLLVTWIKTAAALLKPAGSLTLIYRAEAISDVLAALESRFGALTIRFVHDHKQAPADRVLITGLKARRTSPRILQGLILKDADGSPTSEAHAVLREGAALFMDQRRHTWPSSP